VGTGWKGRSLLELYGLRSLGHLLPRSTIWSADIPFHDWTKAERDSAYPFMSRQDDFGSLDSGGGIFEVGSIRRSDFCKLFSQTNKKRSSDAPPSSVIEKLLLVSPLRSERRYFSFWSLVPNLARTSTLVNMIQTWIKRTDPYSQCRVQNSWWPEERLSLNNP